MPETSPKKPSPITRLLWGAMRIVGLPFWSVHNSVSADGNVVKVVGHDNFILLWPLVPLGGFMYWAVSTGRISEGASGWTLAIAGFILLLAYAKDLDRDRGAIVALVVALFFALAELADLKMAVPIIGPLLAFFRALKPTAGAGFWGLVATAAAALIGLFALPRAFMVGRYAISSRSVDRMSIGKREEMVAVAGNTVIKDWKDLLEGALLLGGGSIVVLNRANGREVLRIDHIMCLFLIFPFIEPLFQANGTRDDENEVAAAAAAAGEIG